MFKTEKFITKKPQSEVIKKYIAYYYFHSIKDADLSKKFVFYPNPVNAITIYKNSFLIFKNNYSIAKTTDYECYNSYYSGLNKQFRIAEIETPFDKIGIAFEPLGINYFIEKPISTLISKTEDYSFKYFSKTIKNTLEQVYATEDIDERVALLDKYFLNMLNDFNEVTLEKAINIIHTSERKLKVTELAEILEISQKTLNRKFKKFLNCTVKTYIDIVQFRKSFNYYLNNPNFKKLTNLSYEFDYFDQAELINKFKNITGINPKKLFNSIEKFGEEELFWNTKI